MKLLFIKVVHDLLYDKHRAMVSFLAIILWMTSFGVIFFSYNIISREIVNVYSETTPASFSITVDKIDDNLIILTENFDGIKDFEQKAFYQFRVETNESELKTLHLFAAKDYNSLRINTVTKIDGITNLGTNEALIERNAIGVANTSLNSNLIISLPDSTQYTLKLIGSINDLSVHPAYMHNTVYAYVSFDTLRSMGLHTNRLDFITTGDKYDRQNIMTISNNYIKILEQNGYKVKNLDISQTPGVSVHLEEYKASLFLLEIFSFISFIFGCMIMINLLSSLLSSQIRQIGILKSIGAKSKNIFIVYIMVLFLFIIVTIIISLPLISLISSLLSSFLMMIGNMLPKSTDVPISLYFIFCFLVIGILILQAIIPIHRGLKISVKDAINDYGINSINKTSSTKKDSKIISRLMVLSIRNAVRRRGRFILNVAILTFGGSIFIFVVTSMLSIQSALTSNLNSLKYDYEITTSSNMNDETLINTIKNIPEIISYESFGTSLGNIIYGDGQIGNLYPIIAPEKNTNMIEPEIISGKWINEIGKNQIVVSHKFLLLEPNYQLGDVINIKIGKTIIPLEIVGVIKDFSTTGIYINKDNFNHLVSDEYMQNDIKIITQSNIRNRNKNKLYQNIEEKFKSDGIIILKSKSKSNLSKILQGHFAVTLQTFLIVILMIIIISGFGLSATMNVQVSERTKEIGIMKSIGASKKQIIKIITSESIFISIISWIIAGLFGLLFSILGIYIFSNNILMVTLDFDILAFITAYGIWGFLIAIVGYLSSRYAAKRAANMIIKNAMFFE